MVNYPIENNLLKILVNQLKEYQTNIQHNRNKELLEFLAQNEDEVLQTLKEDVILDTALTKLERLSKVNSNSEEYNNRLVE